VTKEKYEEIRDKLYKLWEEAAEAANKGELTVREMEKLGAAWRDYTHGYKYSDKFFEEFEF